ncbi:hypothetical protein OAB00_01800 [Akkermansiaceae bacterium]|nr:hypothetical protein [Akkermansiaceae bacterium]
MEKAVVTKVYQNTDSLGHEFRAYVVAVNKTGTEIVVTDNLLNTLYKVGDTIEYMDQKLEINGKKIVIYNLLK